VFEKIEAMKLWR